MTEADTGEYFEANRLNWNERAGIHASSSMYDLDAYRADPQHLSDVVRFDQAHLGDLNGLSAVHLQCHIGTDTLSLARLGADITGLDQSDGSLDEARKLFTSTGTDGRFVEATVYDAPEALGRRYDLVYTGVGALNWLPDISRWAQVVHDILEPGGRLHLREGHPMLWTIDEDPTGRLEVRYPYFETVEPLVWDEAITYTDGDASGIEHTKNYEWNHGIGEIITAILECGMVLSTFEEHRSCEWEALPHMESDGKRFRLPAAQQHLLPLMYTLVAHKPS